jgi:hypothetical protein
MSDKIKDLAEIAANETFAAGLCEKNYDNEFAKRFAELIIQECINLVSDQLMDDKLITLESDTHIREYLKGSNCGVIDSICAIKGFLQNPNE